jgi:hypothetical protein
MDAGFFLVLPLGAPVPSTSTSRPVGRWGDIEEPQGPPRLEWGPNCYLTADRLSERVTGLLPPSLRTGTDVYRLNDKALDLLESEVNGHDVEWGGGSVTDLLLAALATPQRWALVFLWQWEQISEVHRVSAAAAVDGLRKNLVYGSGRRGQIWFGE